MRLKLPPFVRTLLKNLIKATGFWKDNRLILQGLQHFPHLALLAGLFPLLAAVFEGFGIGFLFGFLQTLVSGNGKVFHTGIGWFDVWVLGVNTSSLSQLCRISLLILLSTWIRALFNYLSAIYTELTKLSLLDRLRQQIFEQLTGMGLKFFSQSKAGEITNTITNEISNLQVAIGTFSFFISKGLVLLVYVGALMRISWQLTLASFLLFSLMIVGLSSFNRRVREASFPVSVANGQFTSRAVELVNSMRTVQAYATRDFERRRFYQASAEIVKMSYRSNIRVALIRPLAEGLATTILIGMIIVGMTVFVANGTLQVASLLTFLFVLFRLVPAIQELNGCMATITALQGSITNVEALLRQDDKPYLTNGSTVFTGLKQAIEFVSVDFGYEPTDLILQNVTLTIPKGQTVALVGASGAGKSTLADLIPRFYDPVQGIIRFDGKDLRDYDITSVRRRMAIVSQDTFIFNATVRENIAYGSEDADDRAILEAARQANALDFIQEMLEGLDTQLGDRGVRLSGGQRQRIAIARALLRNPEILILDEATSALDSVSERLIQASLEQLAVGRTVIAIAHRLSTIANADKVVVMERGQVVEQGTYQELLALRGKLWNYHQMQSNASLKPS
ncbi:MAG: heterocyst formation ABC transporter subunit HepA [Leptolyngbya sp. BL-A-14]